MLQRAVHVQGQGCLHASLHVENVEHVRIIKQVLSICYQYLAQEIDAYQLTGPTGPGSESF